VVEPQCGQHPKARLYSGLRTSTRPGREPVGLPPLQTTAPLTITVSMPFAGWIGRAKLAASSTSPASKIAMSAA